jgi:hypothetical protein
VNPWLAASLILQTFDSGSRGVVSEMPWPWRLVVYSEENPGSSQAELRFDFGSFVGRIRMKSGYYQRIQNGTITNDYPDDARVREWKPSVATMPLDEIYRGCFKAPSKCFKSNGELWASLI